MNTFRGKFCQPRLTQAHHDSWRYPVSVGFLFATGLLLMLVSS